MMGTKIRSFAPLPRDLSLEDLVPDDHFYRRLEAQLDLSFVRDLVGPLYANGGRPSVDPVVFFKLQLIMFLEDLRSERQLMRAVADRLSVRWYLGYDLFEPLPDHSSLTRIRERFGLSIIRRCSSTQPRSRPTPFLTRLGRGCSWRVGSKGTWRRPSPKRRPQPERRSLPSWDPLSGRSVGSSRSPTRTGTAGSRRTGASSGA